MDLLLVVMGTLGPIAAAVLLIVYYFLIRPIRMLPLSNESDEGIWILALSSLGKVLEGRVTTARNFLQRQWATLLDSCPVDVRDKLVKLRDKMLSFHVFAIKATDGTKAILLFDQNPEDAKFHMREDSESRLGITTPKRFIHGIRESLTHGKFGGFEFIGISMGETGKPFSDQERTDFTAMLEGVKFLRSSATNVDALKRKEEENKNLKDELKTALDTVAERRSFANKCQRASALKNLNEPASPVKMPFLSSVAKSFFTSFQLAVAFGAFIVTINAATYLNVTYPTPTTLGIAVAFIAFFVTPFIRGMINR